MSATASALEQYQAQVRERDEPTRTKTIRQQYAQNLRGAWQSIRAALTTGIVDRDAFGLQTEALADPPPRRAFDFDREADQIDAFDQWLQQQVEQGILQTYGQNNEYIRRSYGRGLKYAATMLRRAGDGGPFQPVEAAFNLPLHRDQLQALYTRNLGALRGMTDATANDLRRVLAEGLAAGQNPRTIARDAREIIGRVDDGTPRGAMNRATMIARAEVMHSHARATTTRLQERGVDEVTILLAPDACQQCQRVKAGAPYPVEEGPAILPVHPNCRCALTIVPGSLT